MCRRKSGREVTLDVDAHLVGSSNRDARMTYEWFRGCQPKVVCWAETGLALADEFRGGNVPALRGIHDQVDGAYAVLPQRPDGWEVRVRSDSAAYEMDVLDHCTWQVSSKRFESVVSQRAMSLAKERELNGIG